MSHFGLQGKLPVIEAPKPAEVVYYGLYSWMRQQFYADDGGGSRSSETLLAVHEDPEVLRQKANAIWANEDIFVGKPAVQMVIPEGAAESNKWWSNGGGCGASGGYQIKPLPTIDRFVTNRQNIIDDANAERALRAEAERAFQEKQEQRRLADEQRRLKYERAAVENAKRRYKYAANKDEINAKRRVYRAKAAKIKKEVKAERWAQYQEFERQYNAWKDENFGKEISDKKYYEIYNKYHPNGTRK